MTAAKNDMNRVGLFQEMSYVTVNNPYVPSSKFQFNEAAYKGKQMLPGGKKERVTGLQDGYFTKPFGRVFEKEAYTDIVGMKRKQRIEDAKKNITNKPFITFKGETKPEGLGSFYGTFGGKVDYFSPKAADKPKHEPEKANVKTSPPKKGTGYGYATVALEKYPEYKSEKYDAVKTLNKENVDTHKKQMKGGPFKAGRYHKEFFDRNPFLTEKDSPVNKETKRSKSAEGLKPFKPSSPPKKPGNNKDGCFTKFPNHMEEPYKGNLNYKPSKRVVNNSGKLFIPQEGPKSAPHYSVINYNVGIKVNRQNYRSATNISTFNFQNRSVKF